MGGIAPNSLLGFDSRIIITNRDKFYCDRFTGFDSVGVEIRPSALTYASFTPDTLSPYTCASCIHLHPFLSPVAVYMYTVSATKSSSQRHPLVYGYKLLVRDTVCSPLHVSGVNAALRCRTVAKPMITASLQLQHFRELRYSTDCRPQTDANPDPQVEYSPQSAHL